MAYQEKCFPAYGLKLLLPAFTTKSPFSFTEGILGEKLGYSSFGGSGAWVSRQFTGHEAHKKQYFCVIS